MVVIIAAGLLVGHRGDSQTSVTVGVEMSLKEIAPSLGVTPKALARELGLPLDTPKVKPLKALGVDSVALEQTVRHLLSHHGSIIKYFFFAALVFGGLMFLVDFGRPAGLSLSHRREWYPRIIYNAFLMASICVAGFILGKSPNPMEGVVKVFKSMVGLYPDPWIKVGAFLFFILLAVVGNKLICGWACPFGALQELIYSIPILGKLKRHKPPFLLTNTIRGVFFIIVLMVLFGVLGGKRGMVLYHYINPFNLFELTFETVSIPVTIGVAGALAFILYRPFCQFVCPFGLVSWLVERVSLYKVRIDRKACTNCGACVRACPSVAAKNRVDGKHLPADCFSCARCLNVCPVDAIGYKSAWKK
jgi:Pyruvate/2-oxoacid:ferredoxin oxidoreductase delta subunit